MTTPQKKEKIAFSPAKKILFTAILLLIQIFLVEAGLRIYERIGRGDWFLTYYTGSPIYAKHPFLRYWHKPNSYDPESDLHISALGFTKPEISPQKPPGTIRIFCLGGSTTFETTWPLRLGKELKKTYPEQRFEVINAGTSGYTTLESMINFGIRVAHLDPDVITVYHAYNEYRLNRLPNFKNDYTHDRGVLTQKTWFDKLLSHSLFYLKLKKRIIRFMRTPAKRYDDVTEPGLKVYEDNLISILGMARVRGVKVIFSTFPIGFSRSQTSQMQHTITKKALSTMSLTLEGFYKATEKYNDRMRKVVAEYGVPVVENAKLIPPGYGYFNDHIHVNDRGSQLVAENFTRKFQELKWFEKTQTK